MVGHRVWRPRGIIGIADSPAPTAISGGGLPCSAMAMADRLPLIILAGSDRQAGPVPAGLHPEQLLRGCKGAHRLPSGRPLIAELVDRYRHSGRFSEPIVIGPEHV